MTGFLDISSGGSRRLRGLFPTPLVGTAAILAVLIVLTPVLFSNGPPAPGSLLAQAELVIDRVAGGSTTNLYVRAVGDTVRYTSIDLGIARNFVWSGGYPAGPLNWSTWQNETAVLEVSLTASNGSIAVNVTAVYTEGGQTAVYAALLALNVTGPPSGETMSIAISSVYSGVVAPSSIPVGNLPLSIALQDTGS